MSIKFNFNKNLDIDEIKALFRLRLSGSDKSYPILSFDLYDSARSYKKEIVRRRGLLSRYDNVWIEEYPDGIPYFALYCFIKKSESIVEKSYLIEDICKKDLIRQIECDNQFGKEYHTQITWPDPNCHVREHYHYPVVLSKEYTKRTGSYSSIYGTWDETIRYLPEMDNFIIEKQRTESGQIKLKILYYLADVDVKWENRHDSVIKDYIYKPMSLVDDVSMLNKEVKVFELIISEKNGVIGINYCGDGFLCEFWSDKIQKLGNYKNYELVSPDLSVEEYLKTLEYQSNVEIGNRILRILNTELD